MSNKHLIIISVLFAGFSLYFSQFRNIDIAKVEIVFFDPGNQFSLNQTLAIFRAKNLKQSQFHYFPFSEYSRPIIEILEGCKQQSKFFECIEVLSVNLDTTKYNERDIWGQLVQVYPLDVERIKKQRHSDDIKKKIRRDLDLSLEYGVTKKFTYITKN